MRLLWLLMGSSCLIAAHACAVSVKDYPVVSGAGGEASGGNGGAGGTSSTGEGGGGAGPAHGLGDTCTTNDDCEDPLFCWFEDVEGFSFAHGICTDFCRNFTECPQNGSCADGVCALRCGFGNVDPNKCLGRDDMACIVSQKANPPQVCAPRCLKDADCDPDHPYCDPGAGVCVQSMPQGAPPGSACAVGNNMDGCRGWCADGTCIEVCTFGKGGCVPDPSWTGVTLECVDLVGGAVEGDGGICGRLCTCNDDCGPGSICGQPVGTKHYCIGGTFGGISC